MKVLISAPYILPVVDRFLPLFKEAGIEPVLARVEERLDESELLNLVGEVEGVVCGDDQFTEQVLKRAAPRLRVISKWGTGIDSIDGEAAEKFGVRVYRTPDAFTQPVADSVMGYILAFARQLPWMNREMKAGSWNKRIARALHECSLGVVGVGNIGKQVLMRARTFGMQLYGNDILDIDQGFLSQTGVQMLGLPQLLARSDFVSLNCDLNPTSTQLLDRDAFQMMKREAVLINTARGAVVVEADLIEALRKGEIAGAALDVFEQEPLPADSPLRDFENVLLAPHNANSSPAAWERVHKNTLRNLFRGLGLEIPAELAPGD